MRKDRTVTLIAATAGAVGLAADHLVRAPEWGVNVPLAATLLAGAGAAMITEDGRSPAPWPWLASVFFASMWALRDAETLLAVDLLAALALASLPLLQQAGIRLRAVHPVDLCLAPLRAARTAAFGSLSFLQAARAGRRTGTATGPGPLPGLGVGVAFAAPVVLVFGSLFASADPVFGSVISEVLGEGLSRLAAHGLTTAVFTWATAGYLWLLAAPRRAEPPRGVPVLGGVQVLTPLTAMVVLFGLFIGVQATSLFGGTAFVENRTGLTFAEYARGGFFQLVFASLLVLPLVYFAPLAAGPLDQRATARLRGLLGIQLGLTGLVLGSALWRMTLYMRVYGLTVDRINGTALMLWIAGTLGVFALTVVRGRPRHAAFGSLVAAVVTLTTLNLINPDGLIARYDLSHQDSRGLDYRYLSRLGADAAPILAAHIDQVPAEARCDLVERLRARFLPGAHDWRGWNLARTRARDAVMRLDGTAACAGELRPQAGPP